MQPLSGSDTPEAAFTEGHPTFQVLYDSSDTWMISTRTPRDEEITILVDASWRLFKSWWVFLWLVFSGCSLAEQKSKDLHRVSYLRGKAAVQDCPLGHTLGRVGQEKWLLSLGPSY